jgi:hypothetical protein
MRSVLSSDFTQSREQGLSQLDAGCKASNAVVGSAELLQSPTGQKRLSGRVAGVLNRPASTGSKISSIPSHKAKGKGLKPAPKSKVIKSSEKTRVDRTLSNQSEKSDTSRTLKSGGVNANTKGGTKAGQARQIAEGINEYRMTAWYTRAVEAGFKNPAALAKFNELVKAHADSVDPKSYPVCSECGHCDLNLCACFVVGAGVEIVHNDALAIPASVNMRWRFDWVNRIRRMFTWPSFNSDSDYNPNLNGFSNHRVEGLLWSEMLAYLRLKSNTSYVINNVYSREAKLCHMKRLALSFLDERKIPFSDRLTPNFVNVVQHTIQVATDQGDDTMLLEENRLVQNFWPAPSRFSARFGMSRTVVLGLGVAALLSPKTTINAARVSLTTILSLWRRLAAVNAEILANGSTQVLLFTIRHIATTIRVLVQNSWSGLAVPLLRDMTQLSCRIVNTMFTIPSISAT